MIGETMFRLYKGGRIKYFRRIYPSGGCYKRQTDSFLVLLLEDKMKGHKISETYEAKIALEILAIVIWVLAGTMFLFLVLSLLLR